MGLYNSFQRPAKSGCFLFCIFLSTLVFAQQSIPAIYITKPENGIIFDSPATVKIQSITSTPALKVEYYMCSNKLAETTKEPYEITIEGLKAGTHYVTAKMTDHLGNVTESCIKTIRVKDTLKTNACGNTPAYAENGGYGPGSRVVSQGRKYECQEWPNSGWCNGASWAYGPGIGSYWQDAWIDLGSCSGESTDPNPLCGTTPAYTTTGSYTAGNQVANLGKVYECRPWPYSGWCNGAAWAYAPGTGTNWTDAWLDKGYCPEAGNTQRKEISKAATVRTFPNPAEQELHIEINGKFSKAGFTLRDLNGLALNQNSLTNSKSTLNLSQFPAGIYLLEIDIDGIVKNEKVIKL